MIKNGDQLGDKFKWNSLADRRDNGQEGVEIWFHKQIQIFWRKLKIEFSMKLIGGVEVKSY